MRRYCFFLVVLVSAFLFASCGKNGDSGSGVIYGKWIKSDLPGDTLYFQKKNGKNVLSMRLWSGADYSDLEFRYSNGRLSLRPLQGSTDFLLYSTFKWVQVGKSFHLNGNERYPFLSSIQGDYTYNRVP